MGPHSASYGTCTLQDAAGGGDRPFYYRTNSASDRAVIGQVFGDHSYRMSTFPLYPLVERWYSSLDARPLILDLGANIGAASVYFAMYWPRAAVIAVEPDAGNFELLRKNAAGMPSIAFLRAAANDGTPAYVVDVGRGEWGYRTAHAPGQGARSAVPGVTVPLLLARASEYRPFICKIDIEGGEKELFANERNNAWLSTMPVVVIEIHDWMLPGQATGRNFLRAISQHDFDVVQAGEALWCFNNAMLRTPA